jgi:hypothetical protein
MHQTAQFDKPRLVPRGAGGARRSNHFNIGQHGRWWQLNYASQAFQCPSYRSVFLPPQPGVSPERPP